VKLYGTDKKELMTVSKIEALDGVIVIKGKVFGTMPIVAVLRPEEARAALKMVNLKIAWTMFTMFFKRTKN